MTTPELSPSPENIEIAQKILTELASDKTAVTKDSFQQIMELIVEGKTLTVIVQDKEYISTQKAAEILNVSHPYFVQLLDKQEIPYRKVDGDREVLLEGVFNYQHQWQQKRMKVLDELTQQAQELNMGY